MPGRAGTLARPPVLRPFLAALLCGFVGTGACVRLNTPLAWMIGPLFAPAPCSAWPGASGAFRSLPIPSLNYFNRL